MKQEDKDLLLQGICTMFPYGVKCNVGDDKPYTLSKIEIDDKNGCLLDFKEKKDGLDMQVYLSEVKPYLFPLSSMTEEQREEYHSFFVQSQRDFITPNNAVKLFDWLFKNHFDYRGLIEKGLAIDCTNLNIY